MVLYELLIVFNKDNHDEFEKVITDITMSICHSFHFCAQNLVFEFNKLLLFGKFEIEDFEHIKNEILEIKLKFQE
jgi:hypothetical protein